MTAGRIAIPPVDGTDCQCVFQAVRAILPAQRPGSTRGSNIPLTEAAVEERVEQPIPEAELEAIVKTVEAAVEPPAAEAITEAVEAAVEPPAAEARVEPEPAAEPGGNRLPESRTKTAADALGVNWPGVAELPHECRNPEAVEQETSKHDLPPL
jgi:hypothetical protein